MATEREHGIEHEPVEAPEPYRFWVEVAHHFAANRLATGGLVVIAVLLVISVVYFCLELIGVAWPYDPAATVVASRFLGPSWTHLLGTDHLGRDVLARMLFGARISLIVGFVAVGIAVTIGIVVGAVAGHFAGWVDNVLMRLVDIVICFPRFFLILTVVALVKPSLWNIIIVIGLTGWTGTARLIRGEILSLRERDFIQAARAIGADAPRIIMRHLVPNALTPVLVSATLGVAGAILTEAGLSFLGFGVQPPQPTWGNILTEGRLYIFDAWWLTIFPGVAILVTVLAFNLVGEGLRDAWDPRLKV
ncbi:MAG: ABC transporter permease [Candidatus Tectimicrobiota bacterium]